MFTGALAVFQTISPAARPFWLALPSMTNCVICVLGSPPWNVTWIVLGTLSFPGAGSKNTEPRVDLRGDRRGRHQLPRLHRLEAAKPRCDRGLREARCRGLFRKSPHFTTLLKRLTGSSSLTRTIEFLWRRSRLAAAFARASDWCSRPGPALGTFSPAAASETVGAALTAASKSQSSCRNFPTPKHAASDRRPSAATVPVWPTSRCVSCFVVRSQTWITLSLPPPTNCCGPQTPGTRSCCRAC